MSICYELFNIISINPRVEQSLKCQPHILGHSIGHNVSGDAEMSLLNHNHYNDQDHRQMQTREISSNQSGSDSGLGHTNSISSENSLIVNGGTKTNEIGNINTINGNVYNNGGQNTNPHHHAHNNKESIETYAVIDNTGDNRTAETCKVNSPVSKNFVDRNSNNEISTKYARKNLDPLSTIASSKNSAAEKNQNQPNNASLSSSSSLPLACAKISKDSKTSANVCEPSRSSLISAKSRNFVPTRTKQPDGIVQSATTTSAPSNQSATHVGCDSHPDAFDHSDFESLAVSTLTSDNMVVLKSALKKTPNNTVDLAIKTKKSCRNVSFNQTVIVFCEEIEGSSPSEPFDCVNDPYENLENYDRNDYEEEHHRQTGAVIRNDLDILSKIVGEDASKLSDDQLFGLLENGSLLNNIDSGQLSDDDEEFTKTRLNFNQSYLCHGAISDTDSESSLVKNDCKREKDDILKTNRGAGSSSQVLNLKNRDQNYRKTDEAKTIQFNSIDGTSLNCDKKDLSVNCQSNDGPRISQCKVSASLQTKSMPARMKVSPVDNQARRQQHQVQPNHKEENQDSNEDKTETNLIYSDNINPRKLLPNTLKTENVAKSNHVKVKQTTIEPIILSKPILRSDVSDSISQKKQLVQNEDIKPSVDNILIPNLSARPNNQPIVPSNSGLQSRSREISGPFYRLQQPNISDLKNNIQIVQRSPACHICRAIESDRNTINPSMAIGRFNHPIQNDVLSCTAVCGLSQDDPQRSLKPINQNYGTGATNLEQLKQPQTIPNDQSSISCCELEKQQQQQTSPPQNYLRPAPTNFGQQPRPIACQLVYVIDQNGNRVRALQVVNPAQHNGLNTIAANPTRKIFIAPDVNRLPNPSSVSRQRFVHPPDVANQNADSYVAQNFPAKNAQNIIAGNAQPNQQNTLVNRVISINNPTSLSNQKMQVLNHTAPRNHTIFYVHQPLGAQNIRQSLELSPSSIPKSFPDAHEIRRLDGIRAPTATTNFVRRQQTGQNASALQPPQPPQRAATSMQHQSNENKGIPVPKSDDADDPSFGFSRRPAVKVVSAVVNQAAKPPESNQKTTETDSSHSYSLNYMLNNGVVYKNGRDDQSRCLIAGSQTLDRKNRSQQSHQGVRENIPNTSSMSNINRTLSGFPGTLSAAGHDAPHKSKGTMIKRLLANILPKN